MIENTISSDNGRWRYFLSASSGHPYNTSLNYQHSQFQYFRHIYTLARITPQNSLYFLFVYGIIESTNKNYSYLRGVDMTLDMLKACIIPFLGTALGAACVFLLKNEISDKLQKSLLGFAAGVMVAASVWSLLIPAMDRSGDMGRLAFLPAAVGLLLGMAFLLILDQVIPHQHLDSPCPEGTPCKAQKSTMLMLAVTLHNIPEGMAVGVVLASLGSEGGISIAAALALAVGMAIQNFPEGAVISMPLKEALGKKKAFLYGVLSGIVEPIAAIITLLLARFITPVLPYLLSFAAGSMLYVVVEELIPESAAGKHSNIGTIAFALGFTLMMILDVALG